MKIAIPEFNGRVSPVFDNCRRLMLFEVGPQGIVDSELVDWSEASQPYRAFHLRKLGVNVLICGGISGWLAGQVEFHGIDLVPWTAGEINEVLDAYLKGTLPDKRFFMPGCRGRGLGKRGLGRGRGGRGRGRGRRMGDGNFFMNGGNV